MADYDRPHIDVTPLLNARSYKAHQSPGARTFARNREQHGARLSAGLAARSRRLRDAARRRRPFLKGLSRLRGRSSPSRSIRYAKELEIEKPDKGIRQSAAGEEGGRRTMVLHVQDREAQDYLTERVERYRTGDLTEAGNPPLAGVMQPIDDFRPTELADIWREDPAALPDGDGTALWWGLWCWDVFVDDVTGLARALGMQVAPEDRWSTFPDVRVVPVHATRGQVQAMLDLGQPGLAEIGFATDDPAILVDLSGRNRTAWSMTSRVVSSGPEQMCRRSVCSIPGSIVAIRLSSLRWRHRMHRRSTRLGRRRPLWRTGARHAHGGPRAHGDLTGPLADASTLELRHRLESVKFLSPIPRAEDDPANYGAITKAAVALAEERNPDRVRTICSAATNPNR